jgi:hypothetical protein
VLSLGLKIRAVAGSSPTSSAALQFAKTVGVLPVDGGSRPQGGGP